MKIIVKTLNPSPNFEALMTRASNYGATKTTTSEGVNFSVQDHKITRPQFDMIMAEQDVEIEKPLLYAKVPTTILDNLVPVAFPFSKCPAPTEEDPESTERVRWEDYTVALATSADGSEVLLKMMNYECGGVGHGISPETMALWWDKFPTEMITEYERRELMLTDEWKQQEVAE